MQYIFRWFWLGLFSLSAFACGGGGSSGGGGAPPATPAPPAPPPAPPTGAELSAASRTAAQATFGLTYNDIVGLAEVGVDDWLDQQFAVPVTRHEPVVEDLVGMQARGELPAVDDPVDQLIVFRRYAWWNRTMTAPDVLRQRIAFALSQIFVVSDNVDSLLINPYALSTYYDVLLTHAFGNYRDLLEEVALHPAMGVYLSHVNNAKADVASNTFPDENFAREVMQLFSIGLFELNADGSTRMQAGRPIPTYDNDDIREMAKIFTGLSYGGPNASFGNEFPNFRQSMQMFDDAHEPGEKALLNGLVVAAGQTGTQDVQDALDNLFNHPNVGPFIGKQLIQRLVTSNPTPAYVARVSAAFNGDVSGVRGDMRAVIRAVLTDPEALAAPNEQQAGRLREPLVRFISLARQLNATATDGLFYNDGFLQQFVLQQHPLSAPSVFNFYLPSHSPAGALAAANLVAPEFQITTSTTIVAMTNLIDFALLADFVMDIKEPFGEVSLDLSEFEALAQQDVGSLLDRLDVLFTHGDLSGETRSAIVSIAADIPDLTLRTKMVIYLVLMSPDYAVQV